MVIISRILYLFPLFLALSFCALSSVAAQKNQQKKNSASKHSDDGGIFDACRSNDLSVVREYLAESPSMLNSVGPGGQTPLMASVLAGATNVVSFLLKLGADANIGEKDGYTPMHGAGFQGRYDLVPMLVAHGLDPADVHSDGFAPIHRAAWGNEERHARTVQAFLDAGVSCHSKASNGAELIEMTKNPITREVLLSSPACAGRRELEEDGEDIVGGGKKRKGKEKGKGKGKGKKSGRGGRAGKGKRKGKRKQKDGDEEEDEERREGLGNEKSTDYEEEENRGSAR